MKESLPPRLELFSDAVFAIIITIMVLEIQPPHGTSFADLVEILPTALSYALSFVYLIIYWNNHHYLMRAMVRPTPSIMWANAHLLFWLSLVPFATSWLGESGGAFAPTITYAISLLGAAMAYFMLQGILVSATGGKESSLAKALGKDVKGRLSLCFYTLSILAAFVSTWISCVLFIVVALMWMIPDRRLEEMAGR